MWVSGLCLKKKKIKKIIMKILELFAGSRSIGNEAEKQGFDVFSVSLDKSPDAWKRAILQDGLVWPNHVSDLRHWQSAAAKLYNVKGIPQTYLIDKEGVILAKNLRGPALEQKLAELFGT